jgi:hypothetical protein
MAPRDWFSVGVRLIGVWVFYERGFAYFLSFAAFRLNRSDQSAFGEQFDSGSGGDLYYLWYAIGCTILSLYFVFGADHLTRWAFHERVESDDQQPAVPT